MALVKSFSRFSAELEWRNLTYVSVATKKAPSKTILNSVTGVVRPGEFLAIMGPSGAGKTSLLTTLSGKYQPTLTRQTGEILLNGYSITQINYKAMIGFVPQDDTVLETMTPRESLDFAAAMTMRLTAEGRKAVVENTLEQLGLTGCADTIIGGENIRGISGGEKKRTSIGIELIFNPAVLFLDEPTTALDSFTALQIVKLLVKLSKDRDSTIIATIHQPSSQIFNGFDRLLLLSKGTSIFMGRAKDASSFFETIGHPVEINYNPSDHFMNVLSDAKFKDNDFLNNFKSKYSYKASNTAATLEEPKPHFQLPAFYAFFYLLKRAFQETYRNPLLLKGKIMKTIIISCFCSMTFYSLGTEENDLRDRTGAIFMIVNGVIMESLGSTVAIFQLQKAVFLREYFNRKYTVVPFYLSYSIAQIPAELVYSVGFYAIVYYIMALNPGAEHYFRALAIATMASLCGSGYGLLISIIAPNLEAATSMSPLIFLPLNLCGGYLVNYSHIPKWFFLQYISPFRYSMESMFSNDLSDNPDIDESNATSYLNTLDLPESFEVGLALLLVLTIGLRVFGMLVMIFINRKI
jgi:ATP-binding cassette, subfamily G (WHITE), eye pigment precursor transporter